MKTNLDTFPIGQAHTFTFDMTLNPGPGNDVVKISRDGSVVHTGTSWEDDYGPTPPLRFPSCSSAWREAPAYNAAYLGKGYLIDNVTLTAGPSRRLRLAPSSRPCWPSCRHRR